MLCPGRCLGQRAAQILHEQAVPLAREINRLVDRALQLSRQTPHKLGTRTADLLHVATALDLRADYLYTFDQRQRKLAQTLRLKLN
jgi:predicted nucleic acid-binding protein